jgi:uncharacterized phiE125 gp8 family phage protein
MSHQTQGVLPPRGPYLEPRQPHFHASLLGPLQQLTPPSGLVVTLATAKSHCKVDITDDDAYITGLITAAQAYCEQGISGHRQFLTATYLQPVIGWWHHSLRLPRPPLQSVGSITYVDPTGTTQTLATSQYNVRLAWRQPGTIERVPWVIWPPVQRDNPYPVAITFTAGYGLGAAVPATIQQAILLLVGHWYIRREPVTNAGVSKEIEFTVSALLETEGYGSYG